MATQTKSSELPPGPAAPALWQLVRFTLDLPAFLDEQHRRFGDAFTLHVFGPGPFVMLSDPDVVREIFRADPEVLHSGEANEILTASVGRSSVLVLDESPHARQRRVLTPPLKGGRMRAFFDAMRLETLEAVRQWPIGEPFPVLPSMRRITLRVIVRSALGLAAGPRLDVFEHKVEAVLANGRQRWALIPMSLFPVERLTSSRWSPFFRQLNLLNDALFDLIRARRSGESPAAHENVLDDLLAAAHEDGSALSDQEVRDAIFTILVAGHETTAIALAWALAEITPRPDVLARMQEELSRVAGGGPPEAEHIPDLDYLDAAIRESLRLRPIAPFVVRLTKQPFSAGDRLYPPGVVLCPCSYLVHLRADLYPDPRAFRPDHFLDRRYGPHEWFPFGGGNRVCVGMPFAISEMQAILATLLTQVELTRPADARSRPRRYGLVLGPDDGARIIARPV